MTEQTDAKPSNSQSPESKDWIGYVVFAAIAALFICNWIGWGTVIIVLLWGVVVIATLAAIALGIYASEAKRDEDKKNAWIGVGVAVAVAFGAWVFIPDNGEGEGSTSASTKEDDLTPEQLKCRRTLAYWKGLETVLARVNAVQSQNPQQGLNALNAAILEIDRIPAADVDFDAIRCGSALRGWFGMVVSESQRRNSPEAFIEAFVRGYQGDIFGPALEMGQANNAIQRALVELQNQCSTTRAVLSSRYGVEFPPL